MNNDTQTNLPLDNQLDKMPSSSTTKQVCGAIVNQTKKKKIANTSVAEIQ